MKALVLLLSGYLMHLLFPHREPEVQPPAAVLSDSLLPTPVIPKVLHMLIGSQSDT